MTSKPSRDRLSQALADLEAPGASSGFTTRVLGRIDERLADRRRRQRRLVAGGLAATLAAVAVLALGLLARPLTPAPDLADHAARSSARNDDADRRAELRDEYLELTEELRSLERVAATEGPYLYLGSQPDYDLVLDLRPLLETAAGGAYRTTSNKETR